MEDNRDEMEIKQTSQEEIEVAPDVDGVMPVISNILISIDEVDAKGNIIKREFVETQETNELPPSEVPPLILT